MPAACVANSVQLLETPVITTYNNMRYRIEKVIFANDTADDPNFHEKV
jgi:hypothetical protein